MERAAAEQRRRLERLASDEGNVVYEYDYSAPERFADVEQTMKLATECLERRRALGADDDEARAQLCREPKLDLFSRTHPRMFVQMTDLKHGPEAFEVLTRLARFRQQVVREGIGEEEATALASQFLMQRCARPMTEAEAAENAAHQSSSASSSS
jgi:hypothetical protein